MGQQLWLVFVIGLGVWGFVMILWQAFEIWDDIAFNRWYRRRVDEVIAYGPGEVCGVCGAPRGQHSAISLTPICADGRRSDLSVYPGLRRSRRSLR